MKDINWKNIAVIALVSLIVVPIAAPYITPLLRKLPIVGKFY